MKAAADLSALRRFLVQQGQLAVHTLFECPTCQERVLGERRCPACHVFCRALGLGAVCPHCNEPVLLTDLFALEVLRPA